MKGKDDAGYIEKERVFRDRTKKRRGETPIERIEAEHPRHQPYKRRKDWMQLPMADEDEYSNICECPIHEKFYEDDGFGCPYCGADGGV